jgi:hypothetical protein
VENSEIEDDRREKKERKKGKAPKKREAKHFSKLDRWKSDRRCKIEDNRKAAP